jgi:hypothetical protein
MAIGSSARIDDDATEAAARAVPPPPEATDVPPPAATLPAPKTATFRIEGDVNFGVYDPGAGTDTEWTSNITLKAMALIRPIMGRRVGLVPQIGNWTRVAGFEEETSKSVNRTFAGLALYARPFDMDDGVFQIVDCPTYFFGIGMNSPEAKKWMSHELGNYLEMSVASNEYPFFRADLHNWVVWGADVKAGGRDADELGFIGGMSLYGKFLAKTGVPVLEDVELYARFRYWWWHVAPIGLSVPWKDWPELTFGFKLGGDVGGL